MNASKSATISINARNDQSVLALKSLAEPKDKANTRISNKAHSQDRVDIDMSQVYKGLSILGQEVIDKLNGVLKNELPGGIQSLKLEDHTPEKTSDFIVNGTTALFAIYAQQNPKLEGEELLDSFMKTIRSGIAEGYKDAMSILEGIGALKFDGVSEGIAKTMQLVDEKLLAFETMKREQLSAKRATTE
mgnify:CR=1 FL=1